MSIDQRHTIALADGIEIVVGIAALVMPKAITSRIIVFDTVTTTHGARFGPIGDGSLHQFIVWPVFPDIRRGIAGAQGWKAGAGFAASVKYMSPRSRQVLGPVLT